METFALNLHYIILLSSTIITYTTTFKDQYKDLLQTDARDQYHKGRESYYKYKTGNVAWRFVAPIHSASNG